MQKTLLVSALSLLPVLGNSPPARPSGDSGSWPASTPTMRLCDIADEIIGLLASDPDATVQVTLDVSADFPAGAKDHVKRGVSENASNLGFTTKSWE
jgi:hypothetical protein